MLRALLLFSEFDVAVVLDRQPSKAAADGFGVELLRRLHPDEGEPLQEGSEEEEELHPGKTLPQAGPFPYSKGQERIILLEGPIFIQEISWVKCVRVFP